jgi:hypothetical protein
MSSGFRRLTEFSFWSIISFLFFSLCVFVFVLTEN